MITDKSKSGTQPNDRRSGGENASGHDENETVEPKQSSANSSGSNDGRKNEVTDNLNDCYVAVKDSILGLLALKDRAGSKQANRKQGL